ncbi:hypothetical protein [Bradyrhizobium sp. B117]|uniref:hypothetical protein n=1 Tax=Bradyrhizobium sp. B117 TaxID=3140246 RepID=UPI003183E27A
MKSAVGFRVVLIVLALILGCYGVASTVAELDTAVRPTFPNDPSNISAPAGAASVWPGGIPLFRSDLKSNHALIVTLQAIQHGVTLTGSAEGDRARSRAVRTLSAAPYDAELWLAMALLEAQRDPNGPGVIEALKMAYFTGPNDLRLLPMRLDTATAGDALIDPDLADLAQGDVRLMLTRLPEMKSSLELSYRRASKRGRAFLEQAVQTIDPTFLATLRK